MTLLAARSNNLPARCTLVQYMPNAHDLLDSQCYWWYKLVAHLLSCLVCTWSRLQTLAVTLIIITRICAAEMAVRPQCRSACRKVHLCHCNSLGGATWRSVTITGRTDRDTDRQSATQYAAPPKEEGRIIIIIIIVGYDLVGAVDSFILSYFTIYIDFIDRDGDFLHHWAWA